MMSSSFPRITFGLIVLNGEPFTRYNLRALYPFAWEIIVVEGASSNAKHVATIDGHSIDGTLETLRNFKEQEDPEDKIVIVTAEDEGYGNGFWPGEKDEQSQAYAKRATGDYLWQVDIDEFYRDKDIRAVIQMLRQDASITAVTFPEIPFWGNFNVRTEGILLGLSYSNFHRLFKWGPGYQMTTHRPPTVIDHSGNNLRDIRWVRVEQMKAKNIYLFHYTQIFPSQVKGKMKYYESLSNSTKYCNWIKDTDTWYKKSYQSLVNPFRVHTVISHASWLVRFKGEHPRQIEELIAAIHRGEVSQSMRDMTDVERLLNSRWYNFRISLYKVWGNYIKQIEREIRYAMGGRQKVLPTLINIWRIVTRQQRLF